MTHLGGSVAIVGGGIGGLVAALSLLWAGVDVHVYEQAKALGEVGAGIQVSPNASRILHRLGLTEKLTATAVQPLCWHQRRWNDGRTLLRTSLETTKTAFGFPHYQTHRADLMRVLLDSFPSERFHSDHRLSGFTDYGDRVDASFENGVQITVAALVGADGVHSTVREILFGSQDPVFSGCVAYRGLVAAEQLDHLNLPTETQIWMGPGKHFVHYFVRSQTLINFVAVVDQECWVRESWTEEADIGTLQANYEGWHPQVRAILKAVDRIFIWGLFEHPAMGQWSMGRVTLLGDACHAMLPFMAQGAAQAIEDGATLAACLSTIGVEDIPKALRLYESLRVPRAARVQSASAENKKRFHLPDGPLQQQRDAEMAKGSTDWSPSAVAWIYGYDAGVLANKTYLDAQQQASRVRR